ncbi:Acyl-CoA dehydrogenase [Streptomyces misionensis]|uniref:Acyl-CoA dehydrogenase n=1 Tax=Streptomyces misionensis TaxID=67331 RepID=A0A1H4ID41_9ACTN|nr:acyl-CoA dehydrogenase family protein [Streptomyces misionensis]SEB31172.1 Acyl-CoA dehydrogenase [Streptomyces misionensis]
MTGERRRLRFRRFATRLERALDGGGAVRRRRRPGVCAALDRCGLSAYYVPAEYGGELTDYTELHQALRMVARRDPGVALAHGRTFHAVAPVWVSDDAVAAHRVGRLVVGGTRIASSLAVPGMGPEPHTGVSAYPVVGGYRVDGEEWVGDDLAPGSYVSLLSRTSPVATPRAHSLLLLRPDSLPGRGGPSGSRRLAFCDTRVGADALVGGEGRGAEIVLKARQLGWAAGSALPLGAAEHALRERLAGSRPPQTRRFAEAYADLLLCEALSLVAVRSVHLLPGELSVTSAVVGLLVPELTGAAALAEDAHLCREVLAAQFRSLVRGHRSPHDHRPQLDRLFGAAEAVVPFAPERIGLFSRHGSAVLGTLPLSVRRLRHLARAAPEFGVAAGHAERLLEVTDTLHQRLPGPAVTGDPGLGRGYALCFAGAVCAGLWLGGGPAVGDGPDGLWRDGLWLEACLTRVLAHLGVRPPSGADGALFDRLATVMIRQYEDGRPFSLLPFPMAEGEPR